MSKKMNAQNWHDEYFKALARERALRESVDAAAALLAKIDTMTTEQFRIGGEHDEREALRAALAKVQS